MRKITGTITIRILHSHKTRSMTPVPETRKSTLFKQFLLKVTELKNVKFFPPAPTSDTNIPNILFW